MFYNWIEDQNEKAELAKQHAYLIGAFINPEAVQKLTKTDNVHVSDSEDFEKSWEMVKSGEFDNKIKRKRKRIKSL